MEYLILKQFRDNEPGDPVWETNTVWVEILDNTDNKNKYKTKTGAENKEKKLKAKYPNKKFKIVEVN